MDKTPVKEGNRVARSQPDRLVEVRLRTVEVALVELLGAAVVQRARAVRLHFKGSVKSRDGGFLIACGGLRHPEDVQQIRITGRELDRLSDVFQRFRPITLCHAQMSAAEVGAGIVRIDLQGPRERFHGGVEFTDLPRDVCAVEDQLRV